MLRPEYLDACVAAGRFVSEHEYEIGVNDAPNEAEECVWRAPSLWRERIANGHLQGSFDRWRIAIAAAPVRQEGLKRVLRAGGALCIDVDLERARDFSLLNLTYFFADKDVMQGQSAALEELQRAKIPCLLPDFLSDYLIKSPGTVPDVDLYRIQPDDVR